MLKTEKSCLLTDTWKEPDFSHSHTTWMWKGFVRDTCLACAQTGSSVHGTALQLPPVVLPSHLNPGSSPRCSARYPASRDCDQEAGGKPTAGGRLRGRLGWCFRPSGLAWPSPALPLIWSSRWNTLFTFLCIDSPAFQMEQGKKVLRLDLIQFIWFQYTSLHWN